MVGALVAQLESALHIGHVEVGWLVTASTGMPAALTLPFSVFADCVRRTRLLAGAIVVWALAMSTSSPPPVSVVQIRRSMRRASTSCIRACGGPSRVPGTLPRAIVGWIARCW